MNIYLVERTDDVDYDTFDSFVVAATSEQDARETHPRSVDLPHLNYSRSDGRWHNSDGTVVPSYAHGWINDIESLKVTLLGVAKPNLYGVQCASFRAG